MNRLSYVGMLALGTVVLCAVAFPAMAQKSKPIVNLTAIFGKKASLLNAALGKPTVINSGIEYNTPEAFFTVITKDGTPTGILIEVDVTLKKTRKTPEDALAMVGIRVKPTKMIVAGPGGAGATYTKAIGCPVIKFMRVEGDWNRHGTSWNKIVISDQAPTRGAG